jgi:hypothetical protein
MTEKKPFYRRKILWLVVAVLLVIIVALAFVLTPRAKTGYDLTTDIKTSSFPKFDSKFTLAGFKENQSTSASSAPKDIYAARTFTGQGSAADCLVSYSTFYLQSYLKNTSDYYLTYTGLYSFGASAAQNSTVSTSVQSVYTIKTSTNKDFEVASIRYKIKDTVTYVATRGFDELYSNGASSKTTSQRGADPKKGIPVLYISYTCAKSTPTSAQWKKILSQTKVDLTIEK